MRRRLETYTIRGTCKQCTCKWVEDKNRTNESGKKERKAKNVVEHKEHTSILTLTTSLMLLYSHTFFEPAFDRTRREHSVESESIPIYLTSSTEELRFALNKMKKKNDGKKKYLKRGRNIRSTVKITKHKLSASVDDVAWQEPMFSWLKNEEIDWLEIDTAAGRFVPVNNLILILIIIIVINYLHRIRIN